MSSPRVGVVGALTFCVANSQVHSAQEDLDAANARKVVLDAKVKEFAEVPKVYAQVEAAQAQLSEAMGEEVRWSYFLNDLSLKTPGKVWLTKMTVTQDVDGAAAVATAAAPTSTYGTAGLGTVTFEGNGFAHNDVAAWLDALAKQKGLTQPYFTKSDAGGDRRRRVCRYLHEPGDDHRGRALGSLHREGGQLT